MPQISMRSGSVPSIQELQLERSSKIKMANKLFKQAFKQSSMTHSTVTVRKMLSPNAGNQSHDSRVALKSKFHSICAIAKQFDSRLPCPEFSQQTVEQIVLMSVYCVLTRFGAQTSQTSLKLQLSRKIED